MTTRPGDNQAACPLDAIAERSVDEHAALSPVTATYIGVKGHDDRLDMHLELKIGSDNPFGFLPGEWWTPELGLDPLRQALARL